MTDPKPKISFRLVRSLAQSLRRLNGMVWPGHMRLLLAWSGIVFLASLLPFIGSGSRGLLINHLVGIAGGTPDVWLGILIAAAVSAQALPSILFPLQNHLNKVFWTRIHERLTLLMLHKKGEIDLAVHEDPKNNDLFSKIQENGLWRVQNFNERQFFLLQNVLEVTIAAGILLYADWRIFLLVLVGTVPALLVELRGGQEVWDIHGAKAEVRRKFWSLSGHFQNTTTVSELKLFQNVGHFIGLLQRLLRNFNDELIAQEKRAVVRRLLAAGWTQLCIAGAAVWFVLEVVRGEIQVGTFTFLLASVADFRQAVSSLFNNLAREYEDGLFVLDFFRIMDLKPVIKQPKNAVKLPPGAPRIEFRKVWFKYPGSGHYVLRDLSLVIEPGEKVAFVGLNGAGKTTLVKLLCRFYDPAKGKVLIDGRDLRDLDLEDWYSKLGVLFQEYAHYRLLVKEAIAVGRTSHPLDMAKVRSSAVASEAEHFISEWDSGLDQMLGRQFSGGVEPSGGQWQKLALARSFYRDPDVYVLDEPTASVDAEGEERIFNRLEDLPKTKTVLLISHRFSTVRRADRIAVVEQGGLREYGTHKDLMSLDGRYAELFRLQAKGYK